MQVSTKLFTASTPRVENPRGDELKKLPEKKNCREQYTENMQIPTNIIIRMIRTLGKTRGLNKVVDDNEFREENRRQRKRR